MRDSMAATSRDLTRRDRRSGRRDGHASPAAPDHRTLGPLPPNRSPATRRRTRSQQHRPPHQRRSDARKNARSRRASPDADRSWRDAPPSQPTRPSARRAPRGTRPCSPLRRRPPGDPRDRGTRRLRGSTTTTPAHRGRLPDRVRATRRADAVQGKSNPEIAQHLYVSRKTIESHLSAIYRKLDINAREQLAHQMEASISQ